MAAEILTIHSVTPEMRKIDIVVTAIKNGAVILYPTDTGFTLGCDLSNKNAIEKIRQIRNLETSKSMTFLCDSLSNVSEFAKVSNVAYRTIKGLIPGPYTFILPASKLVPKYAQDPKKNTAGIRVPNNVLSQLLLKELGNPLISISAKTENGTDPEDIIESYSKLVDIAVACEAYSFVGESTIIDMTSDTDQFEIVREGAGMAKAKEFIV
ncbi:MAG: L-threonylcarbamoyladenylate synthase [Candidatus Kapabacteria bacterium]|nr:L-threonylcarbamoyladenylate synthase [Candidatus Kapabacteria bacterium]